MGVSIGAILERPAFVDCLETWLKSRRILPFVSAHGLAQSSAKKEDWFLSHGNITVDLKGAYRLSIWTVCLELNVDEAEWE